MTISASCVLNLDEDLKIDLKDNLEVLGFEPSFNTEKVLLFHPGSGQQFYKDISELNFLIGD